MLFDNIKFAFKTRKAWWYTATSRSRARFARTTLGSFWLGLSNLLSIGTLGLVYGTVFSVDDFNSYLKSCIQKAEVKALKQVGRKLDDQLE